MCNQLIQLNEKVRNHIWVKIGNGRKASMWHDKWCLEGPLSKFISSRDVYAAQLNSNTKVCEMFSNGCWNWPNDWVIKWPILASIPDQVLDGGSDKPVWRTSTGNELNF